MPENEPTIGQKGPTTPPLMRHRIRPAPIRTQASFGKVEITECDCSSPCETSEATCSNSTAAHVPFESKETHVPVEPKELRRAASWSPFALISPRFKGVAPLSCPNLTRIGKTFSPLPKRRTKSCDLELQGYGASIRLTRKTPDSPRQVEIHVLWKHQRTVYTFQLRALLFWGLLLAFFAVPSDALKISPGVPLRGLGLGSPTIDAPAFGHLSATALGPSRQLPGRMAMPSDGRSASAFVEEGAAGVARRSEAKDLLGHATDPVVNELADMVSPIDVVDGNTVEMIGRHLTDPSASHRIRL